MPPPPSTISTEDQASAATSISASGSKKRRRPQRQGQQQQQQVHTPTWIQEFLLGGISTACACFFSNPFDVIKTRTQLQVCVSLFICIFRHSHKDIYVHIHIHTLTNTHIYTGRTPSKRHLRSNLPQPLPCRMDHCPSRRHRCPSEGTWSRDRLSIRHERRPPRNLPNPR